jgi:dimethylamine/trimethylamine dehydrogenase
VIVGIRTPDDSLIDALNARRDDAGQAGIASITKIGDCLAPGAIVHAVHSGHRYARELDAGIDPVPYRRDFPA